MQHIYLYEVFSRTVTTTTTPWLAPFVLPTGVSLHDIVYIHPQCRMRFYIVPPVQNDKALYHLTL